MSSPILRSSHWRLCRASPRSGPLVERVSRTPCRSRPEVDGNVPCAKLRQSHHSACRQHSGGRRDASRRESNYRTAPLLQSSHVRGHLRTRRQEIASPGRILATRPCGTLVADAKPAPGHGSTTTYDITGGYASVNISSCRLFRACAESLASENASRLAAMQRADKNINELLEELNGTFHRQRQSI